MSIGDQHAACVDRLNRVLNRTVGDLAIVRIQNPIRLADSEPEPDVTLVQPRADFYASGKPGAADVLLAIEVSDTTLDVDREVKRPLYAENAIPEYWIVNINDSCVEVYRQPQPDGTYRDAQTLRRGQTIDLVALPGCTVAVDQVM
jgi:Uma2 family endonuclease